MERLYLEAALKSSKQITHTYSTSFSLGIKMLDDKIHDEIYAIYGFVRVADEIVDTFHQQEKAFLLQKFEEETFDAISRKFSLNQVLHSFQWVVNTYDIDHEHIRAFLKSMEMDLSKKKYTQKEYEEYIYGSAEVVGLMCLKVFCRDTNANYVDLEYAAKRLGSAFQKINFLRDIKDDFENKGRTYFPNVVIQQFTEKEKELIEKDIAIDFEEGRKGIMKLPKNARLGVYLAYVYYIKLFEKIKLLRAEDLLNKRVRIADSKKYFLLLKASINYRFLN